MERNILWYVLLNWIRLGSLAFYSNASLNDESCQVKWIKLECGIFSETKKSNSQSETDLISSSEFGARKHLRQLDRSQP